MGFKGPCTKKGSFKGSSKGSQGIYRVEGSMCPNSIYFGLYVVPIEVL